MNNWEQFRWMYFVLGIAIGLAVAKLLGTIIK